MKRILFFAVLICGGCGVPDLVRGRSAAGEEIQTHLYALEIENAWVDEPQATGGAFAVLGGDLLVVTATGRIFLLRAGAEAAEFLDETVPMNLSAWEANESFPQKEYSHFRVADILLKAHSQERFELFVTHHFATEDCVRFRLSSTFVERSSPEVPGSEAAVTVLPSWRTVFDADPCIDGFLSEESGGRMVTDGPDHLLVQIGDHGRDGWSTGPYRRTPLSDDPDSHFGKLLRVAVDTGETEIVAIGFRNPQGLVRDADGRLWATDHGPQAGDELNLVEPGAHYGWPRASYGVEYGRRASLPIGYERMGRHDGFREPAFAWVPAIGISNLVVNDEHSFPLWKDDLLVASLKDGLLFRLRRSGGIVRYAEEIRGLRSIRDLAWMPDGRLAVLFPHEGNRVAFLSRSTAYCDEASRETRDVYAAHCESESPAAEDPSSEEQRSQVTAERLYDRHCGSCHGSDLERHGPDGPSLSGVIGRRAGSADGYSFSTAFASLDLVWTEDELVRLLVNPQLFAGGSMMQLSVTEAEARTIVDFLATASER